MADKVKCALDWYEEGKEARAARRPKEDNPYPAGEKSHEAWLLGFAEVDEPDNARASGYV